MTFEEVLRPANRICELSNAIGVGTRNITALTSLTKCYVTKVNELPIICHRGYGVNLNASVYIN